MADQIRDYIFESNVVDYKDGIVTVHVTKHQEGVDGVEELTVDLPRFAEPD